MHLFRAGIVARIGTARLRFGRYHAAIDTAASSRTPWNPRRNGGDPMEHSTSQVATTDSLSAGYTALAEARWADAFACFAAAVAAGESAEAHEGLAMAAWWLDDVPVVFDSRERAYRGYRQAGDRLGAARSAIWIGLDHYIYRGELAIADGWLQRAERLLDGLEPAAEHGWLAIWSGHIALFERHDIAAALAASAETL